MLNKIGIKTILFPFFVFISIILGLIFSQNFKLYGNSIADFGIPIGLFFMIYPAMTKVKLEEIMSSIKKSKIISLMILLNYAVAPFVVSGLGYLFVYIYNNLGLLNIDISRQIIVGVILLGVAPCIAMVIVWTDLSHGNLALGISFVAWNSIIQIITTPFLVYFLARTSIIIDPILILKSVILYLLTPLIAGILTRNIFQRKKYFNNIIKILNNIQTLALLFTIFIIFWGEGNGIIEYPSLVWMIGIIMLSFYFLLFNMGYLISRRINLNYSDSTSIGYSVSARDFEISIAIALSAFSVYPFVIITTAIGPLLEIPLMLLLVWIQLNRERHFSTIKKYEKQLL